MTLEEAYEIIRQYPPCMSLQLNHVCDAHQDRPRHKLVDCPIHTVDTVYTTLMPFPMAPETLETRLKLGQNLKPY
jgi:hypothetical protein